MQGNYALSVYRTGEVRGEGMTELKQCPHCGGEAQAGSLPSDMSLYVVVCPNCLGQVRGLSLEYVVETWNRRVID